MEFLQSGILDFGTKFIISDRVKNSSYIPGSIGFVSYIKGLDGSYQNVIEINVVLIRKGKTGKERLEFSNIKIPIFTFDSNNFMKIMPTVKDRRNFVYINEESMGYTNLMQVSSLNFIGWASALAKKLNVMSSLCTHSRWPSNKTNPINIMYELPICFNEDPNRSKELYGHSNKFRETFLRKAFNMYSSMIRMHLMLDMQRAACEVNAAEFLEFTNKGKFLKGNIKNEYKFTDDNSLLERTTRYYKSIKKDIDKLCAAKNIKR